MASTYFNNDFNAYVNYVYNEYNLKKTNNFLLKVIKILPVILWRTVKDAGIELIFLLLFWVVLAKMSQGRDLVVSLFEPDGLYGYKRIIFTTLAVVSLSISMWIIPAYMFHQRELHSTDPNREKHPLHDHLFFMHRVLPLVPFWLMASVLFNNNRAIFLLAAVTELVLLYLCNKWISKEPIRKRLIWAVGILFLGSSAYFFYIFHKEYTAAKMVLAVNLYLLSALMFLVYHRADSRILDEHGSGLKEEKPSVWSLIGKYRSNSIFYFSLMAIHITVVLLIYYMPFRINIAPESMLLYMFSLYVFGIDLFFYFVNVSKKRQLITAGSIIGLVLLMGVLNWHFNTSQYAMDKNIDSTFFQKRFRDDFAARYEVLKKAILENKTNVPYPIILISGEGGRIEGRFLVQPEPHQF